MQMQTKAILYRMITIIMIMSTSTSNIINTNKRNICHTYFIYNNNSNNMIIIRACYDYVVCIFISSTSNNWFLVGIN